MSFTCSHGVMSGVCPQCSLSGALDLGVSRPQVDGYELIEQLGAGGMGVVWLARDRSLDRLVALKLIPAGGDALQNERLLREGQAAARLRHPHVVAVHALGQRDGAVYLAMEFLEGGNLSDALGGKPMAPREAARKLSLLAGAVAHAHAGGVLHRDIKPSNVLLDAAGEPHLADFGLAAPREGAGELTRPGQVVGTPAYLAPELLLGAKHASPQSDVYGLGAVLYCALTGRPPFVADAVAAVLEQVRTAEPPQPRLLKPDIPRDLETICLHCLEKHPAQRYGTAEEVESDLKRFLRGEPIHARPVSALEKVWRWRARNAALAASLAAGFLLLLALAIGGPIAAVRIERSRRAADLAAASSQAVSDFLENDLLAQAAPDSQPDRDIRLRTVLDRAETRIGNRFAQQPLVEASLRATLARTYFSLGDFATMLREVQRALALRQKAGVGPNDEDSLKLGNQLGTALRGLGRFAEAEQADRVAVDADRRVLGEAAPETLQALNNLGSVYFSEAKYPEARDTLEQALAIKRRVLGTRDLSTLKTMTNLGMADNMTAKLNEAEALDREALAVSRATLGPEAPLTLSILHNLAVVLSDERKLDEAYALGLQTLAIRIRVLGPEHPETLRTEHVLAAIEIAQGHGGQAAARLTQLLEARRRVLGPKHPDTIKTEKMLASLPAVTAR